MKTLKKNIHFTTSISISMGYFYEVFFCTYCKGLFCHLETLCLCLYSSIYAWNTPKLNFTKNPWASLFSRRRLIKISKCSISLTHLDKCSKRLHHCSYFFILAFISADIFHKFTELHSTLLQLHSKFVTSFFPDNALPGEKLLSQIFLF